MNLDRPITLGPIAVTETYMGEFRQRHVVVLEQGKLGIILRIGDTVGHWYLSTLLGLGREAWDSQPVGEKILVDSVSGTYCTNIQDVVKDAMRALVGGGR